MRQDRPDRNNFDKRGGVDGSRSWIQWDEEEPYYDWDDPDWREDWDDDVVSDVGDPSQGNMRR